MGPPPRTFDLGFGAAHDGPMRARVVNGKWVLEDPANLPEGTEVEIVTRATPPRAAAEIYVDAKLREYVHALAVAAGAPGYSENEIIELAKDVAHRGGRWYVTPEDVKTAAPATLARSIVIPTPARAKGKTADDLIREILENTPVP